MLFVAEFLADVIAADHALVTLTVLGIAVAAQLGFQIHAEVRVVVPNILIVLFHFYDSFGNASVSHEETSAQRGK